MATLEELENTTRYKTNSGKQLFDIFEDEISNTKNEIGNYIKPTKIKTIFALKRAILFSMINN